jgi:hypothetical protein
MSSLGAYCLPLIWWNFNSALSESARTGAWSHSTIDFPSFFFFNLKYVSNIYIYNIQFKIMNQKDARLAKESSSCIHVMCD